MTMLNQLVKKPIIEILSLILIVASSGVMSQNKTVSQEKNASLTALDSKMIGYAFGYEWGSSVFEIKDDISMKELLRGMNEALAGNKSELDIKTRNRVISMGIHKIRDNRQKKTRQIANKFIQVNAKKDGIEMLNSGIQFEVIKTGKGEPPQLGDRIKVHFTANSLQGVYLNDTYQQNAPISTKVGEGLPALTEVITRMPIGSKYKVYLHPDLWSQYDVGSKGLSRNDVLIYEVEILSKLFDFKKITN